MTTGSKVTAESIFLDAICSETMIGTFGFNNKDRRLRFGYVSFAILGLEHLGEIAKSTLNSDYLSRKLLNKGFTVE